MKYLLIFLLLNYVSFNAPKMMHIIYLLWCLQNISSSVPWSSSLSVDESLPLHNSKHSSENLPPAKRLRNSDHSDSRHSESPPPMNRDASAENIEVKPSLSDSLLSQTPSDGCQSIPNSNAVVSICKIWTLLLDFLLPLFPYALMRYQYFIIDKDPFIWSMKRNCWKFRLRAEKIGFQSLKKNI